MVMQPQTPYFMQTPAKGPKGAKAPLSKKGRILAVAGGAIALILIATIFMAVLSSAGKAGREELLSVAQQQTELIRISKIGIDRSRNTSAKNLAMTVSVSLQSDQKTLSAALSNQHIKISPKQLAMGKKQSTDKLLTEAEQANKFDAVFIETIQAQLKKYKQTLNSAHGKTSNKKLKALLEKQFKNAHLLSTAKQ